MGACLFVVNGDQVFRTNDGMGSRGPGAYLSEENKLFRCAGPFCSRGPGVLLIEGNKIFRCMGAFCTKGDGAFVLDGNRDIYLAEGPSANKSDAILHVRRAHADGRAAHDPRRSLSLSRFFGCVTFAALP